MTKRLAALLVLATVAQARAQGREGYESVDRRYGFEPGVETIARRLESL